MLPGTIPYQRLVAGIPLHSWILEEKEFDDNDWHDLVTPPSGWSVVVSSLFVGAYTKNFLVHVEWGFGLNGVHHECIPMSYFQEGKSATFTTHWVLPVNAILACERGAGNEQFCVAVLGYFVTSDIVQNQRF